VFVALGIPHIAICGLPGFTIFYRIISLMARFSKEKFIEYQKRVLIFLRTFSSETFLILRKTERDMIRNVYWYSCKVPVILVRFLMKFNFLDKVSKNSQLSNFKKIRPL